jgi:protein SCO1
MNRRELLSMLGTAPVAAAGLQMEKGAAPRAPGQRKWAEISPREGIRKRYFPNFSLSTHEGRQVKFYDDLIKDKMVLINFMYARCTGICPTVMENLARVRKILGDRVGRDIFLYSFTLKPREDTVPVLAQYAEAHGLQPGWSLLTGKPEEIEVLRKNLGFYDSNPELDKDIENHIGIVRYGNEPLMRWGACPGMSEPGWIAKSVLWVDWPQGQKPGGGSERS